MKSTSSSCIEVLLAGLEGPEYLAWLGEQPERDYTILMGANTYRLIRSRIRGVGLGRDHDR